MGKNNLGKIIYIHDNEVVSTRSILSKYPIENLDEWIVTSENNVDFLIARDENPKYDPWMRTMKFWSFDETDELGRMWSYPSGQNPSIVKTNWFSSMCYTTINKKIVKLWRTQNL